MSKYALVTLNIGDCLHENSRASFHDAARRWGCDYVEVMQADEGVHPHAMKLKAFELCDAERVFYIDADAVISAGCPNPFEIFPADAFVAVSNQRQPYMSESCRRACEDTINRDLEKISGHTGETYTYPANFINSGMWLASRECHSKTLAEALSISLALYGETAWKDQSALNYVLIRNKVEVLTPDATWNCQFPPDTGKGMMGAFIYHWAGGENRRQIADINWRSYRHEVAVRQKPRLLVIADHCCPTGFARVAENICKHLVENWHIFVVGINYSGQPHDFPYQIWPAKLYGDLWGLGTFNYLLPEVRPDAIFTVQDPWIAARYATEIFRGGIPMAAYMPVDAKNQHPVVCSKLNKLDLAIFYTTFGEMQARLSGYKGRSAIIPHGADREIYKPLDKQECRSRLQISDGKNGAARSLGPDDFVVGNVNRNQPRKRLDLSIQYFAEWIHRVAGDPRQRIDNAYLYLHCAQRDVAGWDLPELAHYYGVDQRLIIPDAETITPANGLPENEMANVYGCFDVQVTTTAGEGWGLCQLEGMACGIPQIIPDFGALAEWAGGAAYMIPCSDEHTSHPVIGTVGAVPKKEAFIRALDRFYRDAGMRKEYAYLALECARQLQFDWKNIARQFDFNLKEMIGRKNAEISTQERLPATG